MQMLGAETVTQIELNRLTVQPKDGGVCHVCHNVFTAEVEGLFGAKKRGSNEVLRFKPENRQGRFFWLPKKLKTKA